ncbi:MAG: hypothetical protein N2652_10810 [Kiritimatiellae bacterium]|nr:hypothetical protein [Kiritimatiellia bacterium]
MKGELLRVVAVLGMACAALRAAVPNFEPFDYATGTALANPARGSGWGAWSFAGSSGTMTIASGSLMHPQVGSTGGRLRVAWPAGPGTTTTADRGLQPPMSGGTWYIRVLARNLNGNVRYHGIGRFDGGTERALIGPASRFTNWTLTRVAES